MEGYSTISFIQAFIRLSREVSYLQVLQTDEGSQIVKRCETMKLNILDAKCKLSKDGEVERYICKTKKNHLIKISQITNHL